MSKVNEFSFKKQQFGEISNEIKDEKALKIEIHNVSNCFYHLMINEW